MKSNIFTCPICKGTGKLNPPHLQQKMMRHKQGVVKILKKEGYSFREIMKLLNYKSPASIRHLLMNKY